MVPPVSLNALTSVFCQRTNPPPSLPSSFNFFLEAFVGARPSIPVDGKYLLHAPKILSIPGTFSDVVRMVTRDQDININLLSELGDPVRLR
jgi:hypothetical protein